MVSNNSDYEIGSPHDENNLGKKRIRRDPTGKSKAAQKLKGQNRTLQGNRIYIHPLPSLSLRVDCGKGEVTPTETERMLENLGGLGEKRSS